MATSRRLLEYTKPEPRALGPDQKAAIVTTLHNLREVPAMYVGTEDSAMVESFLHGFRAALDCAGIGVPYSAFREAAEKRRWKASAVGVRGQMVLKGKTDEEILRELVTIDLKVWSGVETAEMEAGKGGE